MKKVLTLVGLCTALTVQAQTNTNTSPTLLGGIETLIKSIGSDMPTNFVAAPYASYHLGSGVTNKFGGGMFLGWNISKNLGLGAAVDFADGGFSMFNGELTLKVPTQPLKFTGWSWATNLTVTPFVLGGVGTPMSGAGHTGGPVSAIAAAGGEITLKKFANGWNLGIQGTLANWSGAGDAHDGKHVYGGLTLSHNL